MVNHTSGLQSHVFLHGIFFTRLDWGLSPFPKLRYVSSKSAWGRTTIWSRLLNLSSFAVFCADLRSLHHVSSRDVCRKQTHTRINNLCSARFLNITRSAFRWRNFDFEQGLGHKFTSRWRFLWTAIWDAPATSKSTAQNAWLIINP